MNILVSHSFDMIDRHRTGLYAKVQRAALSTGDLCLGRDVHRDHEREKATQQRHHSIQKRKDLDSLADCMHSRRYRGQTQASGPRSDAARNGSQGCQRT